MPSTSLYRLVKGFLLSKTTEGKSPHTVRYYGQMLSGFPWYADRQGWSNDATHLTEWPIREFLGYVATVTHRWGLSGLILLAMGKQRKES